MVAQTVAVIDSDEAYLRFVARLLALEGFQVFTIPCGSEVVTRLQAIRPDAIILDTWLDDRESGWALLESFLLDSRLRSVPIVLTTSDPVTTNLRRGVLERHPRLAVLAKPFAAEALLAQLKTVLASKRQSAA